MAGSLEEIGGQPGGDAVRRFLQVSHNDDGTHPYVIVGATTSLGLGTTQPTASGTTAATIVNGTGTVAHQDDTYGGWTVAKLVKALQTSGVIE